nr:3-hydroxyacyl-ACP dehydratase FabZ family protein [Allomuricauda sp.]
MEEKAYDKMTHSEILALLPYSEPFLFVDELLHVDEEGVEGRFTFSPKAQYYQGHFKDNPITPGVILTECCAQIGLVCLGIYLLGINGVKSDDTLQIAFSSMDMEFIKPVFPGETMLVRSEKQFFRFNKLKCRVKMYNSTGELVCKGMLAGMIKMDANG